MADKDYMKLESTFSSWAKGKMSNQEVRKIVKSMGYTADRLTKKGGNSISVWNDKTGKQKDIEF